MPICVYIYRQQWHNSTSIITIIMRDAARDWRRTARLGEEKKCTVLFFFFFFFYSTHFFPLLFLPTHISKENFDFLCHRRCCYCEFFHHSFTAIKKNRNERERDSERRFYSLSLFFFCVSVILMTTAAMLVVVMMMLMIVLSLSDTDKHQEIFLLGKSSYWPWTIVSH